MRSMVHTSISKEDREHYSIKNLTQKALTMSYRHPQSHTGTGCQGVESIHVQLKCAGDWPDARRVSSCDCKYPQENVREQHK